MQTQGRASHSKRTHCNITCKQPTFLVCNAKGVWFLCLIQRRVLIPGTGASAPEASGFIPIVPPVYRINNLSGKRYFSAHMRE